MPVDTLDTNLLASRKPKETDPAAAPSPPAKAPLRRKIAKIAAYFVIFLIALVLFTILKIPNSVVTNMTLGSLNSGTPYQFRAEKVSLKLFLLPHLAFDRLELEPKFGEGLALSVSEAKVYPNLFSLIPTGGPPKFSGSFEAEAYQGKFSGHVATGPVTTLNLEVKDLDLAKLTPLTQAGYAVRGLLQSLVADLTLEAQRLSRSDGTVRASGKNLTFDPASLNLGMPLPMLDLGAYEIQGKITKGKLKLERVLLGGQGKDLELRVEGGIQLADALNFSTLDLRLRFRPSDKILEALPGLKGMLGTFAAKRADGFYGMKIVGPVGSFPMPDPN